jgi:predicted MPP superfamily phosphohydrolase
MKTQPPTAGITRRRFLQGMGAIVGAAALTTGYARFGEPNWVQVEEITLRIAGLPHHLAGTRIAQISDIHLGAFFLVEQLQQAITRVNATGAALLLLTGDFVTSRERNRTARRAAHAQIATELVEPLRGAEMPTFASLGNHDLWGDPDAVMRSLAAANVTLLRNDGVAVADRLWLAAVDDIWSGQPDLRAALRGAPAESVNLLMSTQTVGWAVGRFRSASTARRRSRCLRWSHARDPPHSALHVHQGEAQPRIHPCARPEKVSEPRR